MVKGMEGTNVVLPLPEDAAPGELEALLAQAADGLLASLGVVGGGGSGTAAAPGQPGQPAPKQAAPASPEPPFASLSLRLSRGLHLGECLGAWPAGQLLLKLLALPDAFPPRPAATLC